MHIKRSSDFMEIYSHTLDLCHLIPHAIWDGRLDGQFTTIHRMMVAMSDGEYDTDVMLNEAHELTIIVNVMRNNTREGITKRAVQAETLEMTIIRLAIIGLYCFYDSTFVSDISQYDRDNYTRSVKRMMANFAAGMITRYRNRDGEIEQPTWSMLRGNIGRQQRIFYPSLYGNSPWVLFKTFIAIEGPEFTELVKFWSDGTSYIKALYFTRVYECFDREDLISKDTVTAVCATVYREERQTFIEHYEEQV